MSFFLCHEPDFLWDKLLELNLRYKNKMISEEMTKFRVQPLARSIYGASIFNCNKTCSSISVAIKTPTKAKYSIHFSRELIPPGRMLVLILIKLLFES